MLNKGGIVTISIFQSDSGAVGMYAAPFAEDLVLLSDEKGKVVNHYFVTKEGTYGDLSGKEVGGNFPKYEKFYLGEKIMAIQTAPHNPKPAMYPASFLIMEDGTISDVWRGKNMTETIPFDRIQNFIPEDKRCKCNEIDCIVPKCRENYEQIKKDSEAMLHM